MSRCDVLEGRVAWLTCENVGMPVPVARRVTEEGAHMRHAESAVPATVSGRTKKRLTSDG